MNEELRQIVESMVKAGESEEDIALVIRSYKPKTEDPSGVEVAAAGVGGFNRGISQIVTSPLKVIGAAEQFVGGVGYATKAAEAIEGFVEDVNPRYKNVNDLYQGVTEGLGQAVGMMASGGGSTVSKLAQTATKVPGILPSLGKALSSRPAILGGTMTAAPEWEAAKASGLDDQQAFKVLVKNYLIGQTEAIPIERGLGRIVDILDPESKRRLFKFVAASGIGGIEEGLQEALQTYLSNEVAKSDYDPDRDPLFQVLESAEVGGLVGLLMPSVGGIMSAASPQVREKFGRKVVSLQADQSIKETESGDPSADVAVDQQTKQITDDLSQSQVKAPEGDLGQPDKDVDQNVDLVAPDSSVQPLEDSVDKIAKNEESDLSKAPAEKSNPERDLIVEKVNNGEALTVEESRYLDESEADLKFSNLVDEFNQTGALLGGAEESKSATRDAASEQVADFLRGKVKTRKDVDGFQAAWNAKIPTRPITNSEVQNAWDLIKPTPKPEVETITQPINEALKEQIKTFYRGVEKGVRKGQKMVNEILIPKVQEALKGAKLSARQTSAILNKVKTANLFTPGSQSRLNDFIDRVTGEAGYVETLAKTKSLQKRIKKFGRQKDEKIPVKIKILARSFGKLDPSQMIRRRLDEYLVKADEIIGGFRPVESEKYAIPNVTEIEDYIDKTLEVQEEEKEKELAETEKDLSDLKVIAKASVDRLTTKDLSGFDESGKRSIETIKKIDVEQLKGDQLKRLVKIIDNIVENEDLSGEAFVENVAAVQDFVKEFTELTKNTKKSELGLWGRTMYNMSNMLKRIYQDNKIETFFRKNVHNAILTAGSQVESALVYVSERFDKELKRLNKKYKIELRDIDNKADMMVFSLLYQMDNEADMAKVHRNITETINRHEEVGNNAEAYAWKKAHKAFEKVKNFEDARKIIKKKNPAVYEMWQLFGFDGQKTDPVFTNKLAEDQARVSKEVYNREYVPTDRYTPIVQHDVSTLYRSAKIIEEGGEGFVAKKLDPKQARTAKKRTLNLAQNKVYTLEPYTDWILRFGETLYDNKASKAEAKLAELIRHPSFTKLVGGQKNAEALQSAFVRMVAIQRGTNRLISDSEAENFFTELSKTVRSVGTIKALASISQAVKQSTVSVKLFTNLMSEGDADVLPAAIHAVASLGVFKKKDTGVRKLFNMSTMIARGLRMGGTDRGTSEAYKLQRGARRWYFKFLENARMKIDSRTRANLSLLVKPDIFNARVAFLSYYMQSLKHQGVRDVDLNKEHERQDDPARQTAMAYAESMIEKTQTASNPAAMSDIQAQTKSKGWEFVKTVFLPFSTFDSDFKARLVNEISAMRRSPTPENAVRLGGTVGEALTFAALNAFLLYWYKEWLRDIITSLTGNERPEKGSERQNKEQRQQFVSSIANALNPLAIGTIPQEKQAWAINEVGYQIAKYHNPDLSKKEWMKTEAFVYEQREGTLLENLAVYSAGLAPLAYLSEDLPNLALSAADKPITVVDAYGNEKRINLNTDQQTILFLKTLAEGLTVSGFTEADIANAIRAVYKEQMKQAEKAPAEKESTKKSFKRTRRKFRRNE